jgi:hypothetical protein
MDRGVLMKVIGWALVVLAMAAWVAVFAIARYAGMPGFPLLTLYQNSLMVTKLFETPLIMALIVVVVVALVQVFANKAGGRLTFFTTMAWAAPALGLLATAYAFLNISIAMKRTNTTNLMVVAPSASEALLPLAIGLTIAAVSVLANGVLSARAKRKSATAF